MIDTAPGLGTTTIATRYARDFDRRTYRRHGPKTTAGHQRLPVAFIPVSAGITLKGLDHVLLDIIQNVARPESEQTEKRPDRKWHLQHDENAECTLMQVQLVGMDQATPRRGTAPCALCQGWG